MIDVNSFPSILICINSKKCHLRSGSGAGLLFPIFLFLYISIMLHGENSKLKNYSLDFETKE